jgi:carbonic anhydrase/acetyltransferase-like protein (isoleucine patch superfamily)
MRLYDLQPTSIGEVFIAPTATVVGEIYLGAEIAIGHGAVLRGDISPI